MATAGDNGASFKATTVMAMLHWLGIEPSSSRPRVSDDNAFVESLFRTAKYLSSRVPEHRLRRPGGGAPMGGGLRAVVQPPPSPERHRLRQPRATACRPGRGPLPGTQCAVSARRQAHPSCWSGPTRN
ncbi:Integrase catalytic region (fragment) [Xanthomonas citri pv. bilvae]